MGREGARYGTHGKQEREERTVREGVHCSPEPPDHLDGEGGAWHVEQDGRAPFHHQREVRDGCDGTAAPVDDDHSAGLTWSTLTVVRSSGTS